MTVVVVVVMPATAGHGCGGGGDGNALAAVISPPLRLATASRSRATSFTSRAPTYGIPTSAPPSRTCFRRRRRHLAAR